MTFETVQDVANIREAMRAFDPSPSVAPNEIIETERAYFPPAHRGVLDFRRQVVVGNRGMGKSFWTHALTNRELRERVAKTYNFPALLKTRVAIGFNGSEKITGFAPTVAEISGFRGRSIGADLLWKAVLFCAAQEILEPSRPWLFEDAVREVDGNRAVYAQVLTNADNELTARGSSLLVVFDALDLLQGRWDETQEAIKQLLTVALGLQSFRSIRAKIFIRPDVLADGTLFRFPDGSKLFNEKTELRWRETELFGLLFHEILRNQIAGGSLRRLALNVDASDCLPVHESSRDGGAGSQSRLVSAFAGEFMGANKKRGRVYSWVPLHLSDSKNECSPRTFLIAWKTAADHGSARDTLAVDHLGLNEGVRKASSARMEELRQDYPWIDPALQALKGEFVPLTKDDLFRSWDAARVVTKLTTPGNDFRAPIDQTRSDGNESLLQAMIAIAVLEPRKNGKINVPDIFRVEAGIMRRGGVAVPKRN